MRARREREKTDSGVSHGRLVEIRSLVKDQLSSDPNATGEGGEGDRGGEGGDFDQ
jgi:hypothetical protein